jgi:hypothetical protein
MKTSSHFSKSETEEIRIEVPSKFGNIIKEFTNDLSITFSEYDFLWSKWRNTMPESEVRDLYIYCLSIYPERFFDILYQNEDIFKKDNKTNTCFLPGVDFKLLFNCQNITENTKTAIWKYIQLVLFTIVENLKDKSEFGKSMNLFEGMDEKELQSKLSEAMMSMASFFKMGSSSDNSSSDKESSSSENNDFFEKMMGDFAKGSAFEEGFPFTEEHSANNGGKPSANETPSANYGGKPSANEGENPSFMPNADDLHNHLKELFEGKLGSLAKELIEELTEDLKETFNVNDLKENASPKDIFQKLIKNPDKFMKIVQKVNTKFQDKIKKGDISQEDIMKEASEMLKKMKEMGGDSKQMNEMFQNMAKSMGLGKHAKVDTNALDRMMKSQSIKDRMRAKLEKKKQAEAEYTLQSVNNKDNNLVYRPNDAEAPVRSSIAAAAPMEDLDALAASIEAVGEKTVPTASANKKKNKPKNKKK